MLGQGASQVVLKKEAPVIRFVLTALTSLRSLHLPVKVDLGPITDPSTATDLGSWRATIPSFWGAVRSRTRLSLAKVPSWENYHFSVKAGPSGGPAILSALSELGSLPAPLIESIGEIGGVELRENMKLLLGLLPDLRVGGPFSAFRAEMGVTTRKLVGIEDKEGKTRVIAIGDYWSQTALRPLHLWVFRILRRIHQDVTFSQGSFVEKVRGWGATTLYSVDLTSATDRFPIGLIADVLEGILPKKYVLAWQDVMVGYPFTTPTGETVRYSVGNPMGFYSSWGSFALAHHFVVFWCCQDLGIRWGSARYVVLGDDVLIGDPRLGKLYQERILSLGIGISASKSFISNEVCEFAKRYLYRGEEVSPFPVSSVLGNLGDVSLLVSAVMGEARKGFVPSSGIPESIGTLYKRLGRRAVHCRKAVLRAHDCELATLVFQGTLDIGEFVLRSSRVSDPAAFDLLHSRGVDIFAAGVRMLVQKSLESGENSLERRIYADVFEVISRLRSTGRTGEECMYIPLFSLYSQFEDVVFRIHSEGHECLVSDNPPDLSILLEVIVDPLRESSWGLSRRERHVRAYSRLARACRDIGDSVISGKDPSFAARFFPPMPLSHTIRYWVAKKLAQAEVPRTGVAVTNPTTTLNGSQNLVEVSTNPPKSSPRHNPGEFLLFT